MRISHFVALVLALFLSTTELLSQLLTRNEKGITNGHLHLNVRDVETNKNFFLILGGTIATDETDFVTINFPGVVVRLTSQDPIGGSIDSIVNHVGFVVPNVDKQIAMWKAAGGRTEPGRTKQQGFLYTPDNFKIEILQSEDPQPSIGNHHVHFYATEAAIPAMRDWYVNTFGAKPITASEVEADLPGVKLLWEKSDAQGLPTKGRVLDHIGFLVRNLEVFCKELEASGVKFERPYRTRPFGGSALIIDPWGTQVELQEFAK